jgi:predicted nucleic acid-binding protein
MTSVDSNVIFAALSPHEHHHQQARALLKQANEGGLALSPVVYAELMASTERDSLRMFLQRAGWGVLWEMPAAVWERAGVAFGEYARARRAGTLPRRIVADFLIAAHAEHHGLSVLTFDATVYRAVFPAVPLVA